MLRFKRISYKNFLSIGNAGIDLELDDQKTVLVTGRNGEGKSAMVDALSFALFGRSYRDINKPELVNRHNRRGCLVELEFETPNGVWRVKRGLVPSIFEVWHNGKLTNQAARSYDQQDWFEQHVIRMNFQTFSQVTVLGSANFIPFMKLNAAQRRAVCDSILDVSIITDMMAALKLKYQEFDKEVLEVESVKRVNMALSEVHGKVGAKSVEAKEAELNRLKGELDKVKAQAKTVIAEKTTLTTELEELVKKIDGLETAHEDYSSKMFERNALQHKRDSVAERLDFIIQNAKCHWCEQDITEDHRHTMSQFLGNEIQVTDNVLTKDDQVLQVLSERVALVDEVARKQQQMRAALAKVDYTASFIQKEGLRLLDDIKRVKDQPIENAVEPAEIAKVNEKLAWVERKEAELAQMRETLDVAQKLLKDTGIRSLVVNQFLPMINQQTNRYLALLNLLMKFTFDSDFNEVIKSGVHEFGYRSLSMGQRMRVDLALLFMWRDVARTRAQATTNLLIFDEIFDSSLDQEGAEDLMELLNQIGENTSVFVISHRGDQIADKMSQHFRFELQNGFTKLIRV